MKRELKELAKVLTPSEFLVCELVCEGYSNQQIGEECHISKRTVEAHRANIYRKLQIPSQSDLLKVKCGYAK